MITSWISTFLVPVDFSGNKTMWNDPTAYCTSGNHGVVLKLSPIIISPYGAERLMARLWLELASHQRGVWAALGHLMLQQDVNHPYAQKTSLCRAFWWHCSPAGLERPASPSTYSSAHGQGCQEHCPKDPPLSPNWVSPNLPLSPNWTFQKSQHPRLLPCSALHGHVPVNFSPSRTCKSNKIFIATEFFSSLWVKWLADPSNWIFSICGARMIYLDRTNFHCSQRKLTNVQNGGNYEEGKSENVTKWSSSKITFF